MSSTPALAAGLTHSWVRVYTRGVSPDLRERRQAEIESDLWEHESDAREAGAPLGALALEFLGRLVLGVPADLSWRLEHRGAGRRPLRIVEGSKNMIAAVKKNGMVGLSGLLGAFYLFMGIFVPIGGDWSSTSSTAGRAAYGAVVGLGGILVFAGLLGGGRAPRLAGVSLAAGAVIGAAMTFWLVVTPAVTFLVLAWVVMSWRSHTPAPA